MLEKKTLSLEAAKKIATAAEAEAARNKWNVVVAIVDDGGQIVYVERMDGTQYGSVDVAIRKARTSSAFRRATKVFEDAVMTGGRTTLLALEGALPLEGGVPLYFEGRIVGAIGVSGATSSQDGQVAKAGADALSQH
ncbi:MAG: heme-binding protein [Betaproteobacteria bacterium]|nr:heme-binding protein [Betaproteobacteria bacterium]